MIKTLGTALLALCVLVTPALAASESSATAAATGRTSESTADHGAFKILQRDFSSGPEVTKACLTCHTEAAKQVHKSKHWTWEFMNPDTKQRLGKKNVINNFCTSVPSNYAFCTACHVGYGWKDQNFDFTSQESVDCLVCHDNTGTYRKIPGLAGHPTYKDMEFPPGSGRIAKAPDLGEVARKVGKTTRDTCGACHFYGGGGDAVKHGDLDSSLKNPGKYLDVHMAKDGLNFTCGTCHMTSGHDVPGSRYAVTVAKSDTGRMHMRGREEGNPATCESCHGDKPHKARQADRLNSHAVKLACQTCHVPEFARAQPTKMMWDWSTAGKMDKDGKPYKLKDSSGHDSYDSRKGDFSYESNVIPKYVWFNGEINYTLRETKLDPDKVIEINRFEGSPNDGKSKVWPIKRFIGKQPYDVGNNQLLVFHTYGKDDSALWSNFNWEKAIQFGMKEIGAEYSGEYAFVSTEMSWPITHMVAPKQDALACQQCHTAPGRLDQVAGLYIPGRNANSLLDILGWSFAGLAFIGVIAHGTGRILASRKGEQK